MAVLDCKRLITRLTDDADKIRSAKLIRTKAELDPQYNVVVGLAAVVVAAPVVVVVGVAGIVVGIVVVIVDVKRLGEVVAIMVVVVEAARVESWAHEAICTNVPSRQIVGPLTI